MTMANSNARFWLGRFYEQRGEKKIENGEWIDPEENDKIYQNSDM